MDTTETTDLAQPQEGQGDGGTQDAPYSEYLSRIPEEVRGDVEPIFKEWDANTTRRFQDAAEYRKSWEPFEQIGVNQHDPETVQWALQFAQAAQENPQAIQQWFEQYAQENGLTVAEAQAQAETAQLDEYFGQPDPQQLKQLLEKELSPLQQQIAQFNQWREQQEQATRLAEAQAFVQGQMDELKAKHPDEFNEAAIEKLVAQYIDSDPRNAVQRAFADWQQIRGEVERSYAQSKVNQPAPAESGGVADGAPEPIKTLADANRIALAQLRGAV